MRKRYAVSMLENKRIKAQFEGDVKIEITRNEIDDDEK